jgi:hypothetical protein
MEYTAFADPFVVRAEKNGYQYEARVIYGKTKHSCVNIFDVKVTRPSGIAPFCLVEKPAPDAKGMIWVDEKNKESPLYQLIGNAIAAHLRTNLGVVMIGDSAEKKHGLKFKV